MAFGSSSRAPWCCHISLSARLAIGAPFCKLFISFVFKSCWSFLLLHAAPIPLRVGGFSRKGLIVRFSLPRTTPLSTCSSVLCSTGSDFTCLWSSPIFSASLRVHVLMDFLAEFTLTYIKAPDSHRGAEGDGHGARLDGAFLTGLAARPVVRSLYSMRSLELPATTVGEWRRRHSLRRHKAGPGTQPLTGCLLSPSGPLK